MWDRVFMCPYNTVSSVWFNTDDKNTGCTCEATPPSVVLSHSFCRGGRQVATLTSDGRTSRNLHNLHWNWQAGTLDYLSDWQIGHTYFTGTDRQETMSTLLRLTGMKPRLLYRMWQAKTTPPSVGLIGMKPHFTETNTKKATPTLLGMIDWKTCLLHWNWKAGSYVYFSGTGRQRPCLLQWDWRV